MTPIPDDLLAQFHGGPAHGRVMAMPRPFPRTWRVPVIQPITLVEPDATSPNVPYVEYTNESMAPCGRPDMYFPRDER